MRERAGGIRQESDGATTREGENPPAEVSRDRAPQEGHSRTWRLRRKAQTERIAGEREAA